jgi:ubiquinone/menaquinone biosynthesis C-methylase UbiE
VSASDVRATGYGVCVGWWAEHVVPRVNDVTLGGDEVGRSRTLACNGLAGRVLEIGFGSGRNLRYLPPAVTEVGAVEPSDVAWAISQRRRERTPFNVTRVGLDGQAVTAEDASYDAALCTFSLCTIPDPLAALAEVRRVVRPGGTFGFLEHGLAADERTRRWQRRLDPWQGRLAAGCHLIRDPVALLEQAGMEIVTVETGDLPGFSGPAPLTYGYVGTATV